jgi:hypothetical protein
MSKTFPLSVAFCVNEALLGSGSELYRVHRPAQVLSKQLNWLTFVTSRFQLADKRDPWMIEVEGQPLCPQVIILRPSILTEVRADDNYSDFDVADGWDTMRRAVEAAQHHGQIVLLDLDDHPYAWNEFFPDKALTTEQWVAHDEYVAQFNAVLCSTDYLIRDVMNRRLSLLNQRFEYAPNLYDPWRYHPEAAKFGKVLGSHLFVKARDKADFDVLGEALRPVFDADPELMFLHVGEEFACFACSHPIGHHYDNELECDDCSCEKYISSGNDTLAQITGLPADRVMVRPACSPWDLPDAITWNVGVVPLADSPWNYAKTEGKGFEMAAAGVPFVALTGEHPLYIKSPGSTTKIPYVLWQDEGYWNFESKRARAWAERIAQEHQIEYLATMRRLSQANLAK